MASPAFSPPPPPLISSASFVRSDSLTNTYSSTSMVLINNCNNINPSFSSSSSSYGRGARTKRIGRIRASSSSDRPRPLQQQPSNRGRRRHLHHQHQHQHHHRENDNSGNFPTKLLSLALNKFFFLFRGETKGRLEGGIVAAFLISAVQISLLLPLDANAVLYSPDTKVPRTGELALRRAIPANPNMKAIQNSLEDISYLLRIPQRKPYASMEGDVKKALKIAIEEKESILGSIPEEFKEKGSLLYSSLLDGKGGLQTLIQCIKENDPDKVSVALASSVDTLAEIELLQAPGLSFLLPGQYLKYPRLTGRGTVEFTIEKGDGTTFFPTAGGLPKSLATIQVILDGYSAPLTAGNFAKLVLDGAYDGVMLRCTDQAVLVDSKNENYGFSVPLEVMPSEQFEPLYKTTLSIQDGELPVLPLSVYGSVAMAHSKDSEEYSSPSQFFFYLYDKRNAGLGGLSFEEGQFSVFGYATTGREVLSQIKSGDLIRSAKLVEGRERLVLPDDNGQQLF